MSAQLTAAADYIWDKWVIHEHHQLGIPTWVQNRAEVEKFMVRVNADTRERAIPDAFFRARIDERSTIEDLFRRVSDAEQRGASLDKQVIAAADVISDEWVLLNEADQKFFQKQDALETLRAGSDAIKKLREFGYRPPAN